MSDLITVRDLAEKNGVQAASITRKLSRKGYTGVSINDVITDDMMEVINSSSRRRTSVPGPSSPQIDRLPARDLFKVGDYEEVISDLPNVMTTDTDPIVTDTDRHDTDKVSNVGESTVTGLNMFVNVIEMGFIFYGLGTTFGIPGYFAAAMICAVLLGAQLSVRFDYFKQAGDNSMKTVGWLSALSFVIHYSVLWLSWENIVLIPEDLISGALVNMAWVKVSSSIVFALTISLLSYNSVRHSWLATRDKVRKDQRIARGSRKETPREIARRLENR